MNGWSTHFRENSAGERSERRAIVLRSGIWRAYGVRGTCAQKNGRCNASENRFEQLTLGSRLADCERYEDRQVPSHLKELGEDLPFAQHVAESRHNLRHSTLTLRTASSKDHRFS